MSGGGPPSPPQPPFSCEQVRTVPLNSPQPAVAATLGVNERLFVFLDTGGGRRVLQVRTSTGAIAGSLTISGGNIQLRIEPV